MIVMHLGHLGHGAHGGQGGQDRPVDNGTSESDRASSADRPASHSCH